MNRKSLLLAEVKAELRMTVVLTKHQMKFMELTQNVSQPTSANTQQQIPAQQIPQSPPNQQAGYGGAVPPAANLP